MSKLLSAGAQMLKKNWMKRRRTAVTIELDQIMCVRRRSGAVSGWCSGCEAEVVMLTPDEAASVTTARTRALYRLIDAGEIHFLETQTGLIRLCLPSLLDVLRSAGVRCL